LFRVFVFSCFRDGSEKTIAQTRKKETSKDDSRQAASDQFVEWLEQAVAAGRVKRDGEGRPYNTIPLLARRSSIHHL
jgi:hypothetical protein